MIKLKVPGTFKKLAYSGSGISLGDTVSIDSSGNAARSNNIADPFLSCVGFARHISSNHVIVQTDGDLQLSSTVSGQEYWLSSNGGITSSPPTEGVLQKVGIGLPSNKLQIRIDTDIILL